MRTLFVPKSKDTFRSKPFADFVRSRPCCICAGLRIKQRSRMEFHHTIGRGKAHGGDSRGVGACHDHHPQSPRAFLEIVEESGLDIDVICAEYQAAFVIQSDLDIQPFMVCDDPFEELLIAAKLGAREDDSKRITRGRAPSKGKKKSKLAPLGKICYTLKGF